MRKAFTAVELMIVVAIMMLLVGILVPVVSGMRARATVQLAKTRIKALCLAIDAFNLKNGHYPESTSENECSLYEALNEDFMEFAKEELKPSGGSFIVVDPWGNPYVYTEFNSKFDKKLSKSEHENLMATLKPHNPMSYDIYSMGPDGSETDGGKDPQHNGADDDGDGKVDEADELVDDITNY